jgi:hypothetical protein
MLKRWLYRIYLPLNILILALFSFNTNRPRETISGYFGRRRNDGTFYYAVCNFINKLPFWEEEDHCEYVRKCEELSYAVMEYDQHFSK